MVRNARFVLLCVFGLVSACLMATCGGGGNGGSVPSFLKGAELFDCDDTPTCYQDALATVQGCLSESALTMSGDSMDMSCSAGDLVVQLSAFNDNPNGLVPTPSRLTITVSGSQCADIGWGDGTHQDGPSGVITAFDLAFFEIPGTDEVSIRRYETGDVGLSCGYDEYGALAGSLDSCSGGLLYPIFERTDDLSSVSLILEAGDGSRQTVFVCQ